MVWYGMVWFRGVISETAVAEDIESIPWQMKLEQQWQSGTSGQSTITYITQTKGRLEESAYKLLSSVRLIVLVLWLPTT